VAPLLTWFVERKRFRAPIMFLLNLVLISSAAAYCPRFPIRPNSEFFKSKFVVIGTVVSEQTKNDREGFLESTTYLIRVEKTLRGNPGSFLKTYSANDSGRFEMDKGQTYLLFVKPSENHLVVDNCGNSGPRSEALAKSALEAIAKIAKAGPYGEIEGHVAPGSGIDVTGVGVLAISGRKEFFAKIGKDGCFQMRVPAGNYRLKVESNGPAIVPYDLNIDNPDRFTIFPGSSAHFEYDAT